MQVRIWIIFIIILIIFLIYQLIKGRKLLRMFDSVDLSQKIFSTKVTVYSTKPKIKTVLDNDHSFKIIITKNEFIIKPSLIDANSAKDLHVTHIVPIENIKQIRIEEINKYFSTLYISFTNNLYEELEIAIISKKNFKIKEILNKLMSSEN